MLNVRLEKGPDAADRVVTLPDGGKYTILWQTDLLGEVTLRWGEGEDIYGLAVTDAARSTEDCLVMELVFTGLPAPQLGNEPTEAVLNCGGLEVPFTLAAAGETSPEEHAYVLGDLGGVLAIPTRSGQELAVELYPLNGETFSVEPWMTRGSFMDPAPGAVTLTGADGSVHEGTPAGFNPYGTSLYSRWEFGDLPPGSYTLSLPYLLVSAPLPEEFVLPLPEGDGLVLQAPGGSLTAHVSRQPGRLAAAEQEPEAEAFYITFDAAPLRQDLTLAGAIKKKFSPFAHVVRRAFFCSRFPFLNESCKRSKVRRTLKNMLFGKKSSLAPEERRERVQAIERLINADRDDKAFRLTQALEKEDGAAARCPTSSSTTAAPSITATTAARCSST